MLNSVRMGWYLLSKYYELTDECPAYAAALLLHPAMRAKYININWDNEWCGPAITAARRIWQEYKDRPIMTTSKAPQQERTLSKFQSIRRTLEVTEDTSEEDEFEKFVYGNPTTIFCSPLDWWTRE